MVEYGPQTFGQQMCPNPLLLWFMPKFPIPNDNPPLRHQPNLKCLGLKCGSAHEIVCMWFSYSFWMEFTRKTEVMEFWGRILLVCCPRMALGHTPLPLLVKRK